MTFENISTKHSNIFETTYGLTTELATGTVRGSMGPQGSLEFPRAPQGSPGVPGALGTTGLGSLGVPDPGDPQGTYP